MAELKIYANTIPGWDADQIEVFAFHGVEEISLSYQYEIGILVSDGFSPTDAIGMEATFVFKEGGKEGEDLVVHGKFAAIETIGHFDGQVAYRLILVPRVWNMSLALHSRVWTAETIPQIFRWIFNQWGFTEAKTDAESTSVDQFHLDLQDESVYPSRDIVCQYNESDLAFITRWMEREGMYFRFDQRAGSHTNKSGFLHGGTCMVITDRRPDAKHPEPHYPLTYGGAHANPRGKLESLHGRVRAIAYNFAASDYDYLTPNVLKTGSKRVDQEDQKASQLDTVVLYGEHFFKDEAQRIARVRADILTSERHVLHGEGGTRGLKVGRVFECESAHHLLQDATFYLVTRLEHWGCIGSSNVHAEKSFDKAQLRALGALAVADSSEAKKEPYRMRFACVPVSTAPNAPYYRHPAKTPVPKINSITRATVNSGPSQGIPLYAITLDFDELGNSTVPVRLAQPQGQMQFELEAGTEVLVEFLAGNVDRPVISSAVPNPLKFGPAPPLGSNLIQSKGRINAVELNEIAGQQSITTSSTVQNTYLQMGEINDGNAWSGAKLNTQGSTQFNVGQMWNVQTGASVTHSFVDSYNVSLAISPAALNMAPYSHKVEDSGVASGQVTEVAGQITRSTVGDHNLHVGNDYLLEVHGASTVAAQSYGMSAGGNTNMTADASGYHYLPDHIVTVEQDQIESVMRNHSLTVTQDHAIVVGGNHKMAVAGGYATAIQGQHTVTVKVGHTMSVQGPHEIVAGSSSHSSVGAHTLNVGTFSSSTSGAHTVMVQGQSTLTVNSGHDVTVAADHNLVVLGKHEKRITGNYDVVCGNYTLLGDSVNITSNLTIIH